MKDILKILEGYGWKTESINIISQDGSYVTFEFLDEANSYEGGRTIWEVDVRDGAFRHKNHSSGAFWTEWEV